MGKKIYAKKDSIHSSGLKRQNDSLKSQKKKKKKTKEEKQINSNESYSFSVSHHKQELEELKEQDPEFYQHLLENNDDLLKFDDDIEDLGNIKTPDDDVEDLGNINKSNSFYSSLSISNFDSLAQKATESLCHDSIKKIITIFHFLVNKTLENDDNKDPEIKEHVINWCCSSMHLILDNVLRQPATTHTTESDKPNQSKKKKNRSTLTLPIPTSSHLWHEFKPHLKQYLSSIVSLLSSALTIPPRHDIILFCLNHLNFLLPYYQPFTSLCRNCIKVLMKIWQINHESLRVTSFIQIQKMCSFSPLILDFIFKQLVNSYNLCSRQVTDKNVSHLQFLSNCICKIYHQYPIPAYACIYQSFRSIASLLQQAIQNHDPKLIYNYTSIYLLQLWTNILSYPQTENNTDWKPLIYPLVQLITGFFSLNTNSTFFPVKLMLAKMVIQLIHKTSLYIPFSYSLISLISIPAFTKLHKTQKKTSIKSHDIGLFLTISENDLQNDSILQSLFSEDFFTFYSSHISFPELIIPAVIHLKHLQQSVAIPFKKPINQFISLLKQNSEFIKQLRDNINFLPYDLSMVNSFNQQHHQTTPLSIASKTIE